jgi:hypothetical protein
MVLSPVDISIVFYDANNPHPGTPKKNRNPKIIHCAAVAGRLGKLTSNKFAGFDFSCAATKSLAFGLQMSASLTPE